MDRLYDMKLHDTIEFERWYVTRVPGGWIYLNISGGSAVFVPYTKD